MIYLFNNPELFLHLLLDLKTAFSCTNIELIITWAENVHWIRNVKMEPSVCIAFVHVLHIQLPMTVNFVCRKNIARICCNAPIILQLIQHSICQQKSTRVCNSRATNVMKTRCAKWEVFVNRSLQPRHIVFVTLEWLSIRLDFAQQSCFQIQRKVSNIWWNWLELVVFNKANILCIKYSTTWNFNYLELPGSNCSKTDKNCANGSVCVDGHCICDSKTQNYGNAQCLSTNGFKLIHEQVIVAHKHRNSSLKRKLHSYCTSSEDCKKPALCIEKKCLCPEGTTESNDGICIYQKSIGKHTLLL